MYTTFQKRQNYRDNRKINGCQELRGKRGSRRITEECLDNDIIPSDIIMVDIQNP